MQLKYCPSLVSWL